MIKLKKNLKLVWLKKKNYQKNFEKNLILKSIQKNLKVTNNKRIFCTKKLKKKILARWQNCCFTLGLFNKQYTKILMSRFAIKYNNKENKLVSWKVR